MDRFRSDSLLLFCYHIVWGGASLAIQEGWGYYYFYYYYCYCYYCYCYYYYY